MSTKFKFPLRIAEVYVWPKKCVICGTTTNKTNKIKLEPRLTYHIFYYSYHYNIKTISYPICSKHKLILRILRIVMPVIYIGIGLSVVWFLTDLRIENILFCLLLVILFIAIIVFSRKSLPIIVKGMGEYNVTICSGMTNMQKNSQKLTDLIMTNVSKDKYLLGFRGHLTYLFYFV